MRNSGEIPSEYVDPAVIQDDVAEYNVDENTNVDDASKVDAVGEPSAVPAESLVGETVEPGLVQAPEANQQLLQPEQIVAVEPPVVQPEVSDIEIADDSAAPEWDTGDGRIATEEEVAQVVESSVVAKAIIPENESITTSDLAVKKVVAEGSTDMQITEENLKNARIELQDKIKTVALEGMIGGQEQRNVTFIDLLRILFEKDIDVPLVYKKFDDKQKNLYAYDRWISFSQGRREEIAQLFKKITELVPDSSLGLTKMELEGMDTGSDKDKLSSKSLHTRIEDGLLRPRLILKLRQQQFQDNRQIGGLGDRDGVHKLDKAA